ncbi:RHS repeat protein [Rhodococcus spelaei]|uniref:RHS repeat protein n=1 Tax=Rhodococcus spelaei TaxID=2546320 RepID=A0A541B0G1_9NOCA|nr:DUF6531 domain-containing protein [Rhodococcus spelaei]TQF65809.1 RHS repeat protein [Rhodococcus spelaei]
MSWLSDTWDDATGAINDAGDFVEDALESGVEKLGQAVDAGFDAAAGVARNLGAGGVADALTSAGDEIASRTGGPVDELELEQTDQPDKLIRGEPGAISDATSTLADLSRSIADTGQALATIDAADWTGSAADAFNSVYDQQPGLWRAAADAMTAAGQSLTSWRFTVEAAQARAAEAVAIWKRAEAEELAKKSGYAALSAEAQAGIPLVDTWTAMREEAREILRGARIDRDGGAGQVAESLGRATAAAPEEPPFTARMFADYSDTMDALTMGATNFTSGLVTGLSGIVAFVRAVDPTDRYNMTHPAEYAAAMSDLSAGLVAAATNPGAVVSAMLTDIRRHPFEFAGSLTGDAILTAATGGAGGAVAGVRMGERAAEFAVDASRTARLADGLVDEGSHLPTRLETSAPHPDSGEPHGVDAPGPEPHASPAAAGDGQSAPHTDQPNPGPQERAEADAGAHRTAEEAGVDSDRTSGQNCEDRDPVDVATGEFLLPDTDLTLPGVLPLTLARRHRSDYRFGRWFGPSWSATLDLRVVVEQSGVTFLGEDGVMLTYPHPEVGAEVLPAAGQRWPLTRTEAGGYRVHDPDRDVTWHFAPKTELGGLDGALGNLAISAITDRHRNRILFHYAADGAPVEVENSGGYRVLIDSSGGRITRLSVVDGDSAIVVRRFAYTGGHLTAVTNGDAGVTRYGYDDDGRMLTWLDANGNRMTNTYDDRGRVVVQRGTDGILDSTFDYAETADGAGRITAVTDSTGAVTTHGFDRDLRLRDLVDPAGGHTHTDYNSRREPLLVRTPDGATTRYLYTSDGDVARITRPDGRVIAIDYRAPKHPVAVRNPDGSVRTQEWDDDGNLATTVDEAGARTEYGYHPGGSLASVTGPHGAATFVDCDGVGLPAAVTDALGAVTRIRRDGFGRPVAVTDPTGAVTAYRWSAEGRLVEQTHPDGAVEAWEYDGEGNLLAHTDPLGAVTTHEYGAFDLPAARTDPDGSVTRYSWDTERRLVAVTNPLGETWTYRYDRAGRLIAETDFGGATTTYTHDAIGRVATATPATGVTRRHSYDELGRLTGIRADSGEFLAFGHDPVGRMTSAVSGAAETPVHAIEFGYTATGQLRSQTVDDLSAMRFEHDAAGRRSRRYSPSGGDTGWRWDPSGRLAALTADGHHLDFTHDPLGAVTGWKVGELAVTRSHTARGQLAAQTVTARPAPVLNLGLGTDGGPGPAVLRQDVYEYRPDGYLSSHTTVRGDAADPDRVLRRDYALDPVGRVTALTRNSGAVESYTYDRLGNVVTAESGADRREYRGNRLIRDGRHRYRYDAAGRLVRKTTTRISRTPDVWHYRYNAFDQLVGVTTPDGQRWRYTYDALGRRTTKARLGGDGEVVESTRYTWDGTQLVEQTHAGTTTRWNYQPGTHTPLTQASSQGEVDVEFYAIVTDLVGTPVQLVEPGAAETVGTAAASLWGRTTWHGEAGTPLRFPGQYFDNETGLHYNLHRYYDPGTARYVTQDPLGLAPSPNPNAYPHNPTVWTDPLGLVPEACGSGTTTDVSATVNQVEQIDPRPVKPEHALDRWNDFLGPGEHTATNPRTGMPDPDRITSADGSRSIRFGGHEMNSSPTKFHYHEEVWSFSPVANSWSLDNTVVRVPFPKGAW